MYYEVEKEGSGCRLLGKDTVGVFVFSFQIIEAAVRGHQLSGTLRLWMMDTDPGWLWMVTVLFFLCV